MNCRIPSIDLKDRLSLSARFVLSNIDRERCHLPFSAFMLTDEHWSLIHGQFDSPHMVGRFLDTLALCATHIKLPDDEEAFTGLAKRLHGTINAEDGLAWNDVTANQSSGAIMHNQREALLGLLALARWRGCMRSLEMASALVKGLAAATMGQGCFPAGRLTEHGWDDSTAMNAPPAQSGRLIRTLCDYYRMTNDERAVDLAKELADYDLEHTINEDGSWSDRAGSHVHSILGMITGILDLGLLLNRRDYIERAKTTFENGLSPYRSSYGWIKEHRGALHSRGEANCTGDAIQAALLLGQAGHPQFYDDAERMIRNHLLASQVLNTDWIYDSFTPDTEDVKYAGLREHALGGFCFGSPCDYLSHPDDPSPIANDLVHGPTQAIADVLRMGMTADDSKMFVHLLIPQDSSSVRIDSHLNGRMYIDVYLRESVELFLRIPSWVNFSEIDVRIARQACTAKQHGDYLNLGRLAAETPIAVSFPCPLRKEQEVIDGQAYAVVWQGDEVISVDGSEPPIVPMYQQ